MSLREPYDVTGDVPNVSLTVPQQRRQADKLQTGKWGLGRDKIGEAMVTKTKGPSNHTGAKRLDTGTP